MALSKAPFFLANSHISRIIASSNRFIFQVLALMFPRGDDGYSKKRQSQFLSETLRACLLVLDTGKGALPSFEIMEALIHHCIEEGLSVDSLRISEALIEREPFSSEAWHVRSLAQAHAGDKGNALISITKALALNPSDTRLQITHAMLQEHLLTRTEVLNNYHALLESFPGNDDILYALGQYYEKEGLYKEAIKVFTFLENSEEFGKHAISDLGYCYDCLEQYDLAIQWYDKYLDLEPFDPIIWFNKAVVLCHLQQFNNAVSCYDYALAIKENFAGAWYNRGNALGSLGRLLEAIESYKQALIYEQSDVACWHNLGSTLEETGAFSEAIEAFSLALKYDPMHYESYYGRGSCHDALEDYHSAITDYDKALSLHPSYAEVWQAKGDALYNINQMEESLICYRQALTLSPQAIDCAIDCIHTMIEMKQFKEALELIDEYLIQFPSYSDLYYQKAKIMAYIGNVSDIIQSLKIAHSYQQLTIDDILKDFSDHLKQDHIAQVFLP
jgi:tetratricopeptide (TPR) repeat protein